MHPLTPHTPLLGPGASLTDAKPTYDRQQQALTAAQAVLPEGLRDRSGRVAPRALAHAVVDAYLRALPTDATTTITDGTTVNFEPSGLAISTGRRDLQLRRAPGLFVQIDTDAIADTDAHPDGSPKLAVFVNDSTAVDTATHAEPTAWLAEGVNGPVLLANEDDAHAYCEAHGLDNPTPLLIADRQTAADLIGETE